MKTSIFFILIVFVLPAKAQLYKSKEGSVSFFSKAPIENIEAVSKQITSIINTATNEIAFIVEIKTLQFRLEKMRDDFNEDFMESDKYPHATYDGKIKRKINWKNDGTYTVIAKGYLTIHGVEKERRDTATITIRNGEITLQSNFFVRVADYEIRIPRLLFQNIAEVVAVKLVVTYIPYKEEESRAQVDNNSGK